MRHHLLVQIRLARRRGFKLLSDLRGHVPINLLLLSERLKNDLYLEHSSILGAVSNVISLNSRLHLLGLHLGGHLHIILQDLNLLRYFELVARVFLSINFVQNLLQMLLLISKVVLSKKLLNFRNVYFFLDLLPDIF